MSRLRKPWPGELGPPPDYEIIDREIEPPMRGPRQHGSPLQYLAILAVFLIGLGGVLFAIGVSGGRNDAASGQSGAAAASRSQR